MFTTKDYLIESITPAEQAKRLGLKYLGFGRWGKVVNGKRVTTHTTKGDKLEPVKKKVVVKKKKVAAPKPPKKVKVQKGTPLVSWPIPNPFSPAAEEDSIQRAKRRSERYAEEQGLSYEWVRPPEVVAEAKSHASVVQQIAAKEPFGKPGTMSDIRMWWDDQIFERFTSDRERIYATMDRVIKENDLRVTSAKELYRGVYFANQNMDYAKSFVKMIKSGGMIELPPSGFTTILKVAMDFAQIGDPQVSIVFRALPPKKGFKGLHLSSVGKNPHEKETEVVTASSKYQIMSILQQETRRERSITEPDGRLMNVTYTVELQQLEK